MGSTRRLAAATAGFVLLQLASLSLPALAPAAAAMPAGDRITWQGSQVYLAGANVPWFNWACDFGCGAKSGVSSAASNAAIAAGFSQLKSAGLNQARWWVFEGDPWQIQRDASGAPAALDPAVYADFDAALQLADRYDLYYDFVLFSAPSAIPSGWLNDPAQRAKLAQVLSPLFARYKDNPRVMTWEVFNEPDFDIWQNRVGRDQTRATVKAVADAVHSSSSSYVTVGAAMLDGVWQNWMGLGLDYYRAHWYDYMASGDWCARCTDYATLKARHNLDAPLVIGEFYAGPTTDALQRFQDFYAKGYAGATAWSLFADHTGDKMSVDLNAAKSFVSQHPDAVVRASSPVVAAAAPLATLAPAVPASAPAVQELADKPLAGLDAVPPADDDAAVAPDDSASEAVQGDDVPE